MDGLVSTIEAGYNIRFKTCPITNGVPTRMRRVTFEKMCLRYLNGEQRMLSGMGRMVLMTDRAQDRLACNGCKLGRKISEGKRWRLPKEVSPISDKEMREYAS